MHNSIISDTTYRTALDVFGYTDAQINTIIPPARIHAGADHLLSSLKSRSDLAQMRYDMEACRTFMIEHNFVTVMLVWQESDRLFCVRNAFVSSGIFEDPATGVAAAAFAGYLRDEGLSTEKKTSSFCKHKIWECHRVFLHMRHQTWEERSPFLVWSAIRPYLAKVSYGVQNSL